MKEVYQFVVIIEMRINKIKERYIICHAFMNIYIYTLRGVLYIYILG